MTRRIRLKLFGRDQKLFEEYVRMEWDQSDDLGATQAKLAGEWPGFEWLKGAEERLKVYEETLRQIADGPRNTMARRNARATIEFVDALTDERLNYQT